MIKIPKSLDELKQMVSDTNVNEMIGKVKSTIGSATEAVKSVASSGNAETAGMLGTEILAKLRTLQSEQATCLNKLERYVQDLQKQLVALQGKPAEKSSEPSADSKTKTKK